MIRAFVLVFWTVVASLRVTASLPPLEHTGKPLPPELAHASDIKITAASYPAEPDGEIVSTDGYRCAFDFRSHGAGHSNDVTLFFHSVGQPDLKLEFNPISENQITTGLTRTFFSSESGGRGIGAAIIFSTSIRRKSYTPKNLTSITNRSGSDNSTEF